MADKRCPNCGLWNSETALVCDCGFEFASGVVRASPARSKASPMGVLRGGLYGTLGAVAAALPVSVVKTYGYLLGVCRPFADRAQNRPIVASSCGLLYIPPPRSPSEFSLYVMIILVSAALCGALAPVVLRAIARRSPKARRKDPPRLFWRAFAAGVVLDVLFVFILLYQGQ